VALMGKGGKAKRVARVRRYRTKVPRSKRGWAVRVLHPQPIRLPPRPRAPQP
jgi:hypothetical protein